MESLWKRDRKAYHKAWLKKNAARVKVQARRRQAEYRARNPESWRKGRLKKEYGISLEAYQVLLDSQNGVCAVCKQVNKTLMKLAVDHNHATGKVRGLLCRHCNLALGNLREDAQIASAMIEYINRHKDGQNQV